MNLHQTKISIIAALILMLIPVCKAQDTSVPAEQTASTPVSASSPVNPPAGNTEVNNTAAGNTANTSSNPDSSESTGKSTFWTLVNAGGTIGLILFGLSIAAMTLAIDIIRSMRRSVFMPDGLANDAREMISRGQLLAADQRCRTTPCCLSYVINAGLAESDGDWSDIEKTLEDSLAEQSARYMRKIEYLSVIGNIAPMLGLLGTVVGMVYAFSQLADSQGTPKPAELAQGIYLALVTTVEGLIVAIPALAAFAWFRGRVDQLMTEVAFQVQHVFLPLKRQIRAGKRPISVQATRPSSQAPPIQK